MRVQVILLLVACFTESIRGDFDWNSVGNMIGKIKSKVHYIFGGKKENADGRPWFCHDLMCPSYKTMGQFTEKKDGFEERCYPETTWVMTESEGPHGETTSFKPMFMKLFKYIQGENEKKEKVDMTAPVAVSVTEKEGNSSVLNIRMHFFVPPSQVASLPKPTRSDVNIVKYTPGCYYVHSFGGFVMGVGNKMLQKRKELEASLKKAGKDYDLSMLIYAGYDSPFRLIFRHNEVWLGAKTKENETPNVFMNDKHL